MRDLGAPLCTGNGMLRYKEGYILLLNWSIAFLICIINVGGTSDNICKPLMCQILLFLYQCWLSNCIQNIVIFGVPSRHRKWDVMLQWGDIQINTEVCHNLPHINNGCGMKFWQHLQVPYWSRHAISIDVASQIAHKRLGLGYPLCVRNEMLR